MSDRIVENVTIPDISSLSISMYSSNRGAIAAVGMIDSISMTFVIILSVLNIRDVKKTVISPSKKPKINRCNDEDRTILNCDFFIFKEKFNPIVKRIMGMVMSANFFIKPEIIEGIPT